MPLDSKTVPLSFFTVDRVETTVEVLGHELPVAYRRSILTPELFDRIGEEPVAKLLAELILDWALVDDRGGKPVPVPVTEEALRKLPIDFLRDLLWALMEAPRPNPTSGRPE